MNKTKNYLILLLLLFITTKGFCQSSEDEDYVTPVVDYAAIEADVVYHEEQYTYLKKMKENEMSIAALQNQVAEKTAQIEQMQQQIHRSLRDVSRTIQQAHALEGVYRKGEKIVRNLRDIIELVGTNPELLFIANKTERAVYNECVELLQYIDMAILGGNVNLMNTADRARLIAHVNMELSKINGLCFKIKRQMQAALRSGIMHEMLKEYFVQVYRYERQNRQLAQRILNEFHF